MAENRLGQWSNYLVMECARIMSKRNFPATIIFLAVSGEEQGLLGANYLSEKAKKQKLEY